MRAWLTILFTALLGGLCAQESGAVIITEIMYNAASSEADGIEAASGGASIRDHSPR